MTDAKSSFVYVTYIRTTVEELWAALTTPEFTRKFWFGVKLETAWKAGAPWQLIAADGAVTDEGVVREFDRPRRIVLAWNHVRRPELAAEGEAMCVMELEPQDKAVKQPALTYGRMGRRNHHIAVRVEAPLTPSAKQAVQRIA